MRKILIGLIAFVIAFIGSLFAANPSYAVGNCPANWICFYDTSTSSSPIEARDFADHNPGELHQMPSSANNKTSYIWNRSGYQWRVYDGALCNTFPVGTIYANSSGAMSGTYNNNISCYTR